MSLLITVASVTHGVMSGASLVSIWSDSMPDLAALILALVPGARVSVSDGEHR